MRAIANTTILSNFAASPLPCIAAKRRVWRLLPIAGGRSSPMMRAPAKPRRN